MIVFPNCKINLGLRVVRKRSDGFHDIETIFYPLAFTDVLEAISSDQFSFTGSGLNVDGDISSNLCVKAYRLLKTRFNELPPVKMHLHKNIPMGAGLGGGSADGAFALTLLNRKFNLGLNPQELIDLALQLGSDCPFFVINKPCYGTGRGEILEPVSIDLSEYKFVVVNPGIHINTGWAFGQLKPGMSEPVDLPSIIRDPVSSWRDKLINDFEAPVVAIHPIIGDIKNQFYRQGAVYASMTGSGSTLYGIFPKNAMPAFNFPSSYTVIQTL